MPFHFRIAALLCAAMLASCASVQERHPDFGTDCQTLADADGGANVDCVRVYYGTNRRVTAENAVLANAEADISEVMSKNANFLHLGRADVWLPRLIEKGGARQRGETPMLTGNAPKDQEKLAEYVFLTRITTSGKDKFLTDMQAAVSGKGGHSVLLFVHGFNVDFEPALIRSAQLAVDLKKDDLFNPGVPALFSWPSAGKLLSYNNDRDTSLASAPHLTEFLNILTKELEIERINIIAHSMGNRVLTKAIEDYAEAYVSGPDGPEVEFRIIMAAADVDRDIFNQTAGVLDKLEPNVTIYTSDSDRALWVSQAINRATRLGYTDGNKPYIRENPSYQTIDATDVATDLFGLGHGYYSDNPFVLGDMLCTLRETVPEDRALTREHYESDPDKPEFFKVMRGAVPRLPECSPYRDTVPADPKSEVAPKMVSRMLPPLPSPVAPPPPPPPAPVMPEVAPAVLENVIYYPSGIGVLSEVEIEEKLAPTLDDKPLQPTRILIDAYTDTVGSEAANAELSFRRANQIRGWYIARGIDPAIIVTTAHGEAQLPVPTSDNVDEPENRRAVVRLIYDR